MAFQSKLLQQACLVPHGECCMQRWYLGDAPCRTQRALIAEQAVRVELLGVKELFQRPALAFVAAPEAAMAEVNVNRPLRAM